MLILIINLILSNNTYKVNIKQDKKVEIFKKTEELSKRVMNELSNMEWIG